MPRLDTQVPAEGAECLVQGMLCRIAIPTFKAPAFRAAYDLIAINPKTKISATIQVKSRFQTDCDRGFPINQINADYFIFVFLNMGNWYAGKPDEGICAPEFYIVPKSVVSKLVHRTKSMVKIYIKQSNPNFEKFCDAWYLIAQDLKIDIKSSIVI